MTQQDDITQRLRDNADLDEAEHGNARVVQLERDAADEIERLRAELSQVRAPVANERTAFDAVSGLEPPCASRRGNHFREGYLEARADALRVLGTLASAPVAGEAQKPVAWMLIGRLKNSEPKFTLADPADIYESVYAPLYAAPQASAEQMQAALQKSFDMGKFYGSLPETDAEDVRNAALEEAAKLMDQTLRSNGAALIRGLKRSRADKDGGQQREGVVTDDMRYAVRFAPSSAHWSERLKEFFGPDAREGIDALERQLREAHAMLDRQQRAGDAALARLAEPHTGMRVDYQGLLRQAREGLHDSPGLAEMLRQLQGHLRELGQRWYAGDTAVVDELLQLYCVESNARAALSATQTEQGERDAG